MYSGTTFRTKSGLVMGVHQKIDRIAHRQAVKHVPAKSSFPHLRPILHFEGLNGPDGIKRKSPARDEPWHYIDPSNHDDTALIDMIDDHITNMANAMRQGNMERAAFEAAWMSHAIVDGLTPAHHYPLEAKLEELRGGEGLETRISAKDKIVLPGTSRRHQLRNNWEYWGAKGVMTTHLAFELGVASTIAAVRFDDFVISNAALVRTKHDGFRVMYTEALQRVDKMKMYKEFSRLGWTRHLARETKVTLIPEIATMVVLGWYSAALMAEEGA